MPVDATSAIALERSTRRDPAEWLRAAVRVSPGECVAFDGRSDAPGGWGTWAAVAPSRLFEVHRSGPEVRRALAEIDEVASARRAGCSSKHTGIALLLDYEALEGDARRDRPVLIAWEVDRAVVPRAGRVALVRRPDRPGLPGGTTPERFFRNVESHGVPRSSALEAPRGIRTSLPRARYLEAVDRIREHILDGEVYQANLTQTFEIDVRCEAFALFQALRQATPAPHAACVASGTYAVASVSPERFVSITPERVAETWPIKGTRRRGATASEDRRVARELLASGKDRAELLMIVDLERNDLGRVSETGSVEVPELLELRTYPAVHHLVSRVRSRLRPDVGLPAWVEALFPGGSITGAPKAAAIEILRSLEPVPRRAYTGSIVWLGDDGSVDSSILIRTVVLDGERAYLGAGGGVVIDSSPEAEWRESNDKARALAEVLGFAPEDVS